MHKDADAVGRVSRDTVVYDLHHLVVSRIMYHVSRITYLVYINLVSCITYWTDLAFSYLVSCITHAKGSKMAEIDRITEFEERSVIMYA